MPTTSEVGTELLSVNNSRGDDLKRLRELRLSWKAARDTASASSSPGKSPMGSSQARLQFQQTTSPAHRDDVAALIDAATLKGTSTALHIVREQSIRQLKPMRQQWSSNFARRFRYSPNDLQFTSRALAALVEQALHTHQHRVDQALRDAAKARQHATHTEVVAWERNEEALQMFKDPASQHAVRQAVHAYALRANKEAGTLRAALEFLEKETAWAQSSTMAAMRLIATKLTAQQDACVETVLNELEDAEDTLASHERRRDQLVDQLELENLASTHFLANELGEVELSSYTEIQALRDEVARLSDENAKLSVKTAFMTVIRFMRMLKRVGELEKGWSMEQKARKLETQLMRGEMRCEANELKEMHARLMRRSQQAHQAAMAAAEKALSAKFKWTLSVAQAKLVQAEQERDLATRRLKAEEDAHSNTKATLNRKLLDAAHQMAREQSESDAQMHLVRGQNAVLRERMSVMHSTLHGAPHSGDLELSFR